MNSFQGTITSLTGSDTISLVKVLVKDTSVSALFIKNSNNDLFSEGDSVRVIFKETEVIMAKGDVSNISLQNKFTGTITAIENSKVLSKIEIDSHIGSIHSIITSNAVKQLNLTVGDAVHAMVKTNEILLAHD